MEAWEEGGRVGWRFFFLFELFFKFLFLFFHHHVPVDGPCVSDIGLGYDEYDGGCLGSLFIIAISQGG